MSAHCFGALEEKLPHDHRLTLGNAHFDVEAIDDSGRGRDHRQGAADRPGKRRAEPLGLGPEVVLEGPRPTGGSTSQSQRRQC